MIKLMAYLIGEELKKLRDRAEKAGELALNAEYTWSISSLQRIHHYYDRLALTHENHSVPKRESTHSYGPGHTPRLAVQWIHQYAS